MDIADPIECCTLACSHALLVFINLTLASAILSRTQIHRPRRPRHAPRSDAFAGAAWPAARIDANTHAIQRPAERRYNRPLAFYSTMPTRRRRRSGVIHSLLAARLPLAVKEHPHTPIQSLPNTTTTSAAGRCRFGWPTLIRVSCADRVGSSVRRPLLHLPTPFATASVLSLPTSPLQSTWQRASTRRLRSAIMMVKRGRLPSPEAGALRGGARKVVVPALLLGGGGGHFGALDER